jgi:hypothetical protein
MNYYIGVISPEDYELPGVGRASFGCLQEQRNAATQIHPGDKFICYVTKRCEWVGVLEVQSDYYLSRNRNHAPYVLRFKVRVKAWLPIEKTLSIREEKVWKRLSFTRGQQPKDQAWKQQFRRGLNKLSDKDGKFLEHLVMEQQAHKFSSTVDEAETGTGSIAAELEQGPAGSLGAGFGSPEENKKVEMAAIALVRKQYESDGWNVTSRERDRCGFDLECSKGKIVENVEVKGCSGTEQSFPITAGEVKQAKTNPDFVLMVVTSALSPSPQPHRYPGSDFLSLFALSVVQYRAILRK